MAEGFTFQDLYRALPDPTPQQMVSWEKDTTSLLREEVVQLEQRLCSWVPVRYCVSVPSAADGLYLALRAAGIEQGDQVLLSGFAPYDVTQAIVRAGAEPMPVDINPNSLNMDIYCLEYVLGKCIRTMQPLPRALIATDMFGLPCNYPALSSICAKHNIVLISDATQSLGGTVGGVRTGRFGRFAVTSFSAYYHSEGQGNGGGAVFCHRQEDERMLRALLEELRPPEQSDAQEYIQANIANQQLEDYQANLESRRQVAKSYRQKLKGVCRMQQVDEPFESAYTKFVIALPDPYRREEILAWLAEQEVECQGFTVGKDTRQIGSEWERVMLVNALAACGKLISIPIYPYLSEHLMDVLCQRITEAVRSESSVSLT